MSTSLRKIGYYDIRIKDPEEKDIYLNNDLFIDTIILIEKESKIEKREDIIKSNKFYFLDMASRKQIGLNTVIKLIFKSAKFKHRPDLIHHKTLKERDNPKLMEEGEEEKTHIILKKEKDRLLCLFEEKQSGITFNQFIRYITMFNKKFSDLNKAEKFLIEDSVIPGGDFIDRLESLDRVTQGEFFVDLSIIGSDFSQLANDTTIKPFGKLSVSVVKFGNMKKNAKKLFKFQKKNPEKIIRIRYKGYKNDNPILLDSNYLKNIEHITVKIDKKTGLVNSDDIFDKFEKMIFKI